jgi:hypothetical protein
LRKVCRWPFYRRTSRDSKASSNVFTTQGTFSINASVALQDKGIGIEDIKEMVGHVSINTTLGYAKNYGEKQAQKNYKSPTSGMNIDLAEIGLPTINT